jgi:hypothetical protein
MLLARQAALPFTIATCCRTTDPAGSDPLDPEMEDWVRADSATAEFFDRTLNRGEKIWTNL